MTQEGDGHNDFGRTTCAQMVERGESATDMITCPSCKGSKGGNALVCGPGVSGVRWMPCSTCKATGTVTHAHLVRIEYGRLMCQDRIRRRSTVREEAARLGCGLGEWSRIEHGDEPETEEGRRALGVRRGEELKPPPENMPDRHRYQAAEGWPNSLCTRCGKPGTADVHANAQAPLQ